MMSEEVQKSVNLPVAALLDLRCSLLIVSGSSSVNATYQNHVFEELLIFLVDKVTKINALQNY